MTYAVAINVTKIYEYLIIIRISNIYKDINVQSPTGKIVLSSRIIFHWNIASPRLSIKVLYNDTQSIDYFLPLFRQIRLQKGNRRFNKIKRSKIKASVHMRKSANVFSPTFNVNKDACGMGTVSGFKSLKGFRNMQIKMQKTNTNFCARCFVSCNLNFNQVGNTVWAFCGRI